MIYNDIKTKGADSFYNEIETENPSLVSLLLINSLLDSLAPIP